MTGPSASDVADPRHGFEAPAGPVSGGRQGRRRALGATAAVVAIGLLGLVAGLAGADHPRPLAAASPGRTAVVAARPPDVARSSVRRSSFGAPIGLLSTQAGIRPSRQAIVAIPGCDVTLQLSGRQPRRIRECTERLPSELGQMLNVGPGARLQFEVPGWEVQTPARRAIVGPSDPGMWTVTVAACLSRGTDWLCATWYATVNVGA